jgi:hypothetical protein
MPMPEAAVDEDYSFPFPHDQVRAPWQILSMKSEPKSQTVQNAADHQFWGRIRTADRPHNLGAPVLGKNVHIY